MSEEREDPRYLKWDFIEKIADNELSKIVGIIPVVGYLLLFNDKIADALSFDRIVGVDDSAVSPFLLTSIVKLRFAFFGSILVLIANIIFKLWSPRVLVHSKSDLEFSDKVLNSYSRNEIIQIEEEVSSTNWIMRTPLVKNAEKKGRDQPRLHKNIYENRIYMISDDGDYIRALSREWWVGENHSNWIARWVTLLFGVAGYAMLTLPTLDIAQAVIIQALR